MTGTSAFPAWVWPAWALLAWVWPDRLEEVLGMADRVLVMHEGSITGELSREKLNEEAIMQLATGNKAAA